MTASETPPEPGARCCWRWPARSFWPPDSPLTGCSEVSNNPHPLGSEKTNTIFAPILSRSPKYLDPASSYSNDETPFTYQIYEPLYGYHYLKRPYELVGRAAEEVAHPVYLDKAGKVLEGDAPGEDVAETQFIIKLRPGIKFAPHPAFARNAQGEYAYHNMKREDVADKYKVTDFKRNRHARADGGRLCVRRSGASRRRGSSRRRSRRCPTTSSALKEYGERIVAADKELRKGLAPTDRDLPFLDFREYSFAGVEALDTDTLKIRVIGKYPQFKYWLAMTFLAPVPWEAEKFYAQPGMAEKNLTLNFWPVGTGPFMQTEYIENRRHVIERNPNFRGEPYPCEGEPGDKEKGLSRRLRQDDAVRRQGGVRPREGRRAAAGEVPPGLLRFAGHRAARLRHGDDRRDERRQEEGQGIQGEGHQAADDDRSEQLVHRLQLARPGRRQGRHAGAAGAQSQAAAGAVDRHRLGRAHRDLRAWPGRRRAGPAAAVALRLSRGRAVCLQPRRLHARRRRQARCAVRSTRRRSSLPRRAIPTAAMRRPASRWCSTSTISPRPRPASRRCSTGTRSSSRRSASSSRSARPTTTGSRTR